MNLLANSTGGTLASAVAARLPLATAGAKAGMDMLAQGYAALSLHNAAVLPENSTDAFASEGAAHAIGQTSIYCGIDCRDLELLSLSVSDTTQYVTPAIAESITVARSEKSAAEKAVNIGAGFSIDGAGCAISREIRTEIVDQSSGDADVGDPVDQGFDNTTIESAERFGNACAAGSEKPSAFNEIGTLSFIVPGFVAQKMRTPVEKREAAPVEIDGIKTNAGSDASAVFADHLRAGSDVDAVLSRTVTEGIAIGKADSLSSTIFVGAAKRPGAPDKRKTGAAILDHLVAHLTPASSAIIAQEGVSLSSHNTVVSTFSVSPGLAGTTNISVTAAPRGGDRSAEVHFIESGGRIEFAGIEHGRSMGATHPLPSALPIPTFSPAGILRDGMVEPGHGLPGRSPYERDDSGESEAELEERITSLVLDQLRKGPDSSSAASSLTQLNNYLVNNGFAAKGRAITPAAWIRMIRRALGLVVRSVPLFDADGLRTVEAIRHDAAAIADMDPSTLKAWEGAFDTDFVSEQLFRIAEASDESVEADITERLETGLRKRVPTMARSAVSSDFIDPAIGLAGEANLQWGIGVISAMEGIELKVRAAMDFLSSVHRKNPKAAGKGMALIIRHSGVTKRDLAEQSLFDRWTEAEVRSLIASIMRSEMWEIMSQRAMRTHFSDEPHVNAFLNEVIFSANYTKAIEDLNRIDVTRVSDEVFWDAVEKTGAEETLMDTVIARMAQFN
jgi:hypothetical protein